MGKGREIIGQGYEHSAYRAHRPNGWVLKRKTGRWNSVLTGLELVTVNRIRREYAQTAKLALEAGIKIPQTRIFKFSRFKYVIAQKEIVEDGTVDKIPRIDALRNNPAFKGYDINLQQFISSEGNLYWIDSNRGFGRYKTFTVYGRLLHKFKPPAR
ncbi:MAG TPA: hypothetical protein VJC10_03510 [Patescibacteria group bacterium]|nr:hypothetical protein [Patescibacteria group bacterium]